ncbi:MAG: hypothetical protein EZS28_037911 [Streblomastix strix]|uniref:Uncharacterized protein n=1 Tax=Streblomastix strix TaxID=222440 RepID=A0A5J4U9I5_9EUKA|nr:MAG: hypothetical protein EZS28_037911 [Streblomastix strix]
MPEVIPLLNDEGPGYARRKLESPMGVTQRMVMLINDAARNDTDHLVRKMLKIDLGKNSLYPTIQLESATVRWGDNPSDPEKQIQMNDQMEVRRSTPEINVPAAAESICLSNKYGSGTP